VFLEKLLGGYLNASRLHQVDPGPVVTMTRWESACKMAVQDRSLPEAVTDGHAGRLRGKRHGNQ
jgi:hypothetical protein